ncbi:cytochrome P450 [Nonomuraea sp. KM90]|uniref:cytochrome P450 n=1 Tax=Nonomuraea sp. KM90 TaxID=3457428 RepID=UPI003FCC2977
MAYNPNDPELRRDPFPTYRWLRDEKPLYHNPDLNFWALSRHQDVADALRRPDVCSSDHGPALEQFGPNAAEAMGFVAMDPPLHTERRRLVSHAFTSRRVSSLEPRIRKLTREYLATLLERGTGDFVADFAARIPVDVISELIGVPAADRSLLLRLSHQIMTREDLHGRLTPAVEQANVELYQYYIQLITKRRRSPKDDLASALLQANSEGKHLSDGEVAATLMLLGIAGNETTIRLLTTAWRCAWEHPDQRAAVWSGDIGISAWAEEALRFEGPSQYTARRVTRPTEWHGAVVPTDTRLLLLIAAANRDERAFPDGDRFDMRRDPKILAKTLAFGLGPHFCLGALLARLEATVVLQELVAAVKVDYDLDIAHASWSASPIVRGHAQLPTTIKPR